jgi:hypothetical protein
VRRAEGTKAATEFPYAVPLKSCSSLANGLLRVFEFPPSTDATCPVVALETWLKFARISHRPLFRRVLADGKSVDAGGEAGAQ